MRLEGTGVAARLRRNIKASIQGLEDAWNAFERAVTYFALKPLQQACFSVMQIFRRALYLTFLVFVSALLGACGTIMPLGPQTKNLDLSQESIGLLMLEQTRVDNRPIPLPNMLVVSNAETGNSMQVKVDTKFLERDSGKNQNLIPLRFSLAPGKYHLRSLDGFFGNPLLLPGVAIVPLDLMFEVPENSVFYMGRLHVHMRPRTDTEFLAGPYFPLASQAVFGVTTSTFDVQVTDAAESDLPVYRNKFPVLKDVGIPTHLLPAFDRSRYDNKDNFPLPK